MNHKNKTSQRAERIERRRFGDCVGRMFSLVAFLTFSAVSGRAETQLDKWIAEALDKNPEVRAASNRWHAARAAISGAGALNDPMFGADVERMGTSLRSFNDVEYMVQQDVPWFGKRDLATKSASAEARMAEMDYRMKSLDVIAGVKMVYYDLWQTRQENAVNLRTLALLDRIEKAAAARYENGRASQADLIKVSNEKTRLVENQVDLSRERENAHAEVVRLLGREQGASIEEIPDALIPKFRLDTAAVRQLALARQPAIIGSVEGGVAAAQAQLDLARKSYRPDFQFRIEGRQLNGEAGIQEYDTAVFLNLPWFNRRKNDSAIASAKATLDQRHDEAEAMRRKVVAEVQKLCVNIATFQHHYDLYQQRLLPQQRTAVEASRAAYESGTMDFLDLLDAQRMLLEFEMLNAHHTAEAFRLAAELETFTGGELPQIPAEKPK